MAGKRTKAQRDADFRKTWGYDMAKETAEQRFRRLAMVRMNKVLKQVSLIGNLAGSRYKSTPQQIEKMEQAFRDTLTDVFSRLKGQAVAKVTFTL